MKKGCDLNKNGSHGLIYLNGLSLVHASVWEGLKWLGDVALLEKICLTGVGVALLEKICLTGVGVALLEKMCLTGVGVALLEKEGSLRGFKTHGKPKFSLFLLPMDQDVKLSVWGSCLLCATMLPITMIID